MKKTPGRYQRVRKGSDGYKRGYRFIDYGKTASSKIRLLKHKPKLHYR